MVYAWQEVAAVEKYKYYEDRAQKKMAENARIRWLLPLGDEHLLSWRAATDAPSTREQKKGCMHTTVSL